MTGSATFDAYDPSFTRDPYPTLARLRDAGPSHDDAWGLTFFGRHRDVTGILRHRAFGRDIRHLVPDTDVDHRTYPRHLPTWYRMIRGSFIDLEPPEHTRIRGSVSRAFTRRRAETRRSAVRRIAERLLEGVDDSFDVIADYATPIPITVIADLMGVPASDHHRLLDWSHAIVRVFDVSVTRSEEQAAEEAVSEFAEYLRSLITLRRREPADDLISELVGADDPLDDDDLISSCILILNASHEATVHAIGNAVLALARDPGAYQSLARDPDLGSSAVDELLRYDAPLQMFERWVLEPIEWGGHRFAVGDKVGLLFGAANRDPEVFEQPNDLIIDRSPNPHVSLGLGTHFCLGAPLARIEMEEAIGALVRRFRRIHSNVEEPPRHPSLVFRGVTRLDITGEPR